MDQLLADVCGIVADIADVEPDQVGPESQIYSELAVDSLGSVELFVELYRRYGVDEPDSADEAMALSTPQLLADYIREIQE